MRKDDGWKCEIPLHIHYTSVAAAEIFTAGALHGSLHGNYTRVVIFCFLAFVTLPLARGFGDEASPNRSRPLPLNHRLSRGVVVWNYPLRNGREYYKFRVIDVYKRGVSEKEGLRVLED